MVKGVWKGKEEGKIIKAREMKEKTRIEES